MSGRHGVQTLLTITTNPTPPLRNSRLHTLDDVAFCLLTADRRLPQEDFGFESSQEPTNFVESKGRSPEPGRPLLLHIPSVGGLGSKRSAYTLEGSAPF